MTIVLAMMDIDIIAIGHLFEFMIITCWTASIMWLICVDVLPSRYHIDVPCQTMDGIAGCLNVMRGHEWSHHQGLPVQMFRKAGF